MNIKNRMYPYPILSSEKNDYENSKFEAKFETDYDDEDLTIKYNIEMDNISLQGLLKDRRIKCFILCEDVRICFRKKYEVTSKQGEIIIPLNKLNDKLEISVKMVALEEITNITITGLVSDYKGMSFNFHKGNIIGYTPTKIIRMTKTEKLQQELSIFSIVRHIKGEYMTMNFSNNDKVEILLPEKDYDRYTRAMKNTKLYNSNINAVIFPALVSLLHTLSKDINSYKDRAWCNIILEKYKKQYNEELDLDSKSPLEVAQQLIENPINRYLKGLDNIFK